MCSSPARYTRTGPGMFLNVFLGTSMSTNPWHRCPQHAIMCVYCRSPPEENNNYCCWYAYCARDTRCSGSRGWALFPVQKIRHCSDTFLVYLWKFGLYSFKIAWTNDFETNEINRNVTTVLSKYIHQNLSNENNLYFVTLVIIIEECHWKMFCYFQINIGTWKNLTVQIQSNFEICSIEKCMLRL